MAATAAHTETVRIAGPNGKLVEYGIIRFDSDDSVALPTKLTVIENWNFTKYGTAGDANALSLGGGTLQDNNKISVGTAGVTAYATGTSQSVFAYQLVGH